MAENRQAADSPHEKFQRLDGADYERVNGFVRDRIRLTAREGAIARLCADYRTPTGVPMTRVGEIAPEAVPFIDQPLHRGDVAKARHRAETKLRRSANTTLYGLVGGLVDPETADEILFEAGETARFLLEVEGSDVPIDRETAAERALAEAARSIRATGLADRHDRCPACGGSLG